MGYKCLTGWITTPSRDDPSVQVPFFVKVRSKDICWDVKTLPSQIQTAYSNSTLKNVSSPNNSWRFTTKDWSVTYNTDSYFDAYYKFKIRQNTTIKSTHMLTATIEFPFIVDTETLHIQTSLCAHNDYDCGFCVSYNYTQNSNYTSSLVLNMYHPETINKENMSWDSFICVSLHGKNTLE